jgi:hypothetical protein
MSESFDPGGFYEFDLSRGAVMSRDGLRVLVLSDTVVAPLVSAAVKNGDLTPVRRLGRQIGHLVKESMGGEATHAVPEEVLGHAASCLALFGWGRLGLERWGDALVATLSEPPELDEDHLGVAALLGGLFSEITGREVACVPTDRDGGFILVDPTVAEQVWAWSKSGDGVGAILQKMTRGGAQ